MPNFKLNKSVKKRIGIISIHPAPYRDPVFQRLYLVKKDEWDMDFITLFDKDKGHPYQESGTYSYPIKYLEQLKLIFKGLYWHSEIKKILKDRKYDAILVPGYSSFSTLYAIIFSILTKTPMIYSADSVLYRRPSGIKKVVKDLFNSVISKHSAAAWVPGIATREFLNYYGMQNEKIFFGSYCLDVDLLANIAKNERKNRVELRTSLGIDEDKFVFLYVGRMIPIRGLRVLIKAFEQVVKKNSKAYLLMIGNGVDRCYIENYVAKNHIPNVKIFDHIPISKIGTYYALSDAYVLPSLLEMYSLGFVHAAISLLPLISTNQNGASVEFVVPGKTGYIVKAGSAEQLRDAMICLMTDKEKARLMGEEAYRIALKHNVSWATEGLEKSIIKALNKNS
ncbi:glycosyltransferase [candidate division WWE3 bacterium]|jgi:glycosyltransferase involved in cell wall biosynthesis|uniref:Glycosyltransferase n=1 Tax=candidate division WWE3 bacterium TaxID=2053526 RepID=A0A3A4ZNS5_UNCKA|nr:MAG: glycosyltransferase [candidate division WWE3 bacterium]